MPFKVKVRRREIDDQNLRVPDHQATIQGGYMENIYFIQLPLSNLEYLVLSVYSHYNLIEKYVLIIPCHGFKLRYK